MKRLMVACLVLILRETPANARTAPVPASSWSNVSTIIDTGITEPNDVAVGSYDNVYIIKNSAHHIKKVDADGNVFVADTYNHRIQRVNIHGSVTNIPIAGLTTPHDDTTNTRFVDIMYQNVMGRTADPEGHTFWLNQLDAGMTQGKTLLMFSNSPEFKQITYTS